MLRCFLGALDGHVVEPAFCEQARDVGFHRLPHGFRVGAGGGSQANAQTRRCGVRDPGEASDRSASTRIAHVRFGDQLG